MGYFAPTEKLELIHELGICGCGNPELAYKGVYELLKNAKDRGDLLVKMDEAMLPYALCLAYMLDNMGFTTHGSSIYGAWLTDKGVKLYDALERVKTTYGFDCDFLDDVVDDDYFYAYKETEDKA